MLRSAILAVATAGLMLGLAAPAAANAAMSGATKSPMTAEGVVIDVRRGGHGGRHFGHRGGGRHFGHRGGGRHWGHGGRRHWGGRHHGGRHWRHRRGYRYGGIYFGAPYLYYGGYGYSSCGWLYRKAVRTGSRYWWRRYNRCRY